METNPQGYDNKTFLISCINNALDVLKQEKEFRNVGFEFQEGLKGISGTPRVSKIMMERSLECDIFIGDMTIVQRLGELTQKEKDDHKTYVRYSPNANVLMEYAIALNRSNSFWEQVILVMNKVNGDVHDNAELFPFDIRDERYPITFIMDGGEEGETVEKVTNRLVEPIREAARSAIRKQKDKFKPLIGWEEQKDGACYSGPYEWTQSLKEYKDAILSDKDIVRLIGLSGYGKTRLVLESFRDFPNRERYLYCDVQVLGEQEVYRMAMRLFKEYEQAVLVVDNCDLSTHKTLLSLRKSNHVRTKLITIFYDSGEKMKAEWDYVAMSEKQNEVVERIFNRFRSFKDEGERFNFLESTGGNPMIAVQLVKSMMEGDDSGRIDDTNFMTRMLGYEESSDERAAMQALALFSELEYDDMVETHDVLQFVVTCKSILNTSRPDESLLYWMIEIINNQIKRGNIERAGTIIRIRPQALRDGLFEEWQEHCDTGRLSKVIKDISNSPHQEFLSEVINERFYSLI